MFRYALTVLAAIVLVCATLGPDDALPAAAVAVAGSMEVGLTIAAGPVTLDITTVSRGAL